MNEIELSHLFKLLLSKIWVLIIAAAVFAASAYCYFSFAVSPVYRATGSIIVTNGAIITENPETSSNTSSKVVGSDISASLYLVQTIVDIMRSNDTFKELANQLGGKYSYGSLMGNTTVSSRSDSSLVIDISFKSSNPDDAIYVLNSYLSLAPDYVTSMIPYAIVKVLTVADRASMIYPRTIYFSAVAALVGAALAYVVVFIFDLLDHAIKGEDDFKAKFDMPVLGVVPNFDTTSASSYYAKGGYDSAPQ